MFLTKLGYKTLTKLISDAKMSNFKLQVGNLNFGQITSE